MQSLIEKHTFIICVSVGIISILAGWFMLKFPPKEINHLYGYRTKSSMKNRDRWKFAQKYSAHQMIRLGLVLTVFGIISPAFPLSGMADMMVGLAAMILIFVILFFRVEKAIKENFK